MDKCYKEMSPSANSILRTTTGNWLPVGIPYTSALIEGHAEKVVG
jgi:hypothetical protein